MRDAISPSGRARITHEIARIGVWSGTRARIRMIITHSGPPERPIRAEARIERRWVTRECGTVFEAVAVLNEIALYRRAGGRIA